MWCYFFAFFEVLLGDSVHAGLEVVGGHVGVRVGDYACDGRTRLIWVSESCIFSRYASELGGVSLTHDIAIQFNQGSDIAWLDGLPMVLKLIIIFDRNELLKAKKLGLNTS